MLPCKIITVVTLKRFDLCIVWISRLQAQIAQLVEQRTEILVSLVRFRFWAFCGKLFSGSLLNIYAGVVQW